MLLNEVLSLFGKEIDLDCLPEKLIFSSVFLQLCPHRTGHPQAKLNS